jgi:nitrous oxidase accessory protein
MDRNYARLGLLLIACLLAYLAVSLLLAAFPPSGTSSPAPSPGQGGRSGGNLTLKKAGETALSLGQLKNLTVNQGNSLEFTLNRTDLRGRVLSYSAGSLPRGALFFPGNNTLRWTPDLSQSGVFSIDISARNGSLSTGQKLYITVKAEPLPDARNMTLKNFFDLAGRAAPVSRGYPGGFDEGHFRLVHPNESIQAAVDRAGTGEAIIVERGLYPERILVTKPLTLWGVGNPVIDGQGQGSPVSILVDGVTVDGFTLRNSGSSPSASGIKIASNRNLIVNNTLTGNGYGISLLPPTEGNLLRGNWILNNSNSGMYIPNTRYVEIRSNTIVNNRIGMEIEMTWDSVITGNTVSFNRGNGITMAYSQEDQVSDNTIMNNGGSGLALSQGGKNRITGNYLGKNTGNGIETRDFFDNALPGNQILASLDSLFLNFIANNTVRNQKGDGIIAERTNNLIEENEVGNNRYGISLLASQNLARDNVVKGNTLGIYLLNAQNNTLTENTLQGNTNGIKVDGRSVNNEFVSNLITSSRGDGFTLGRSAGWNLLLENVITNNSGTGLVLSGNNTLKNNLILNNAPDQRAV